MKDRADYARKGIARGRSVVVLQYDGGIVFVAENLSRALHKISEIYDRIAFAAVGKYNEFENLRMAGVRYADLRGYSYDRQDVTGRGLANVFAQTLGTIFTVESKPYEVEIVIAEVGETAADDQVYRLTYDGSVADEHGFVRDDRAGWDEGAFAEDAAVAQPRAGHEDRPVADLAQVADASAHDGGAMAEDGALPDRDGDARASRRGHRSPARRSGCPDVRCLGASAGPRLASAEHRHRGAPARPAPPRRRPRTRVARPGCG